MAELDNIAATEALIIQDYYQYLRENNKRWGSTYPGLSKEFYLSEADFQDMENFSLALHSLTLRTTQNRVRWPL